MIETETLNLILLFAIVIIALTVRIIRLNKANADFQTPISAKSIVTLLRRNGISSTVKGPWILFNYQGQEYTIHTSKLPVLVVVKQTSLEGLQERTNVLRDIAQAVSLDTAMASIHIDGNPATRAIIQVNAIETCLGAFAQRLSLYLDIIDETEKRFFDEREKKYQKLTGYQP